MSGGEAVSLVSGRPAAVVHAACPPLWLASQAAGEIIPIAECRRMVLYSSIQAATLVLARDLAGKSSTERSSNSSVEWNDSMTALSSAEPGLPIDWRMPSRSQAAPEETRGVLAALIGMQDHAVNLAAANCRGHRQRPVGQLRVVMPGQGEPEDPP